VAVFIREIRNNAGGRATIRNLANESQTSGDSGFVEAGESKHVDIAIPRCEPGDQNSFGLKHVRIDVERGTRFAIWQASANKIRQPQ
jgi:hypothetical protein